MISIDLSGTDDALVRGFMLSKSKALHKAMLRAVRKTHGWLARQLASAIAKETLIPRKNIKFRVLSNFDGKSLTGRIWIGLNPLSARRAGEPRQARFGARAGKHRFEKAFVASMKNGPAHIWKRSSDARLPIEKQLIDIEEPGMEVISRLEKRAEGYFQSRLNEELNYALNHEKA